MPDAEHSFALSICMETLRLDLRDLSLNNWFEMLQGATYPEFEAEIKTIRSLDVDAYNWLMEISKILEQA